MKVGINLSILILILTFNHSLWSQSQEFLEGYMITTNQDTIYGFLKDEKRNLISQRFLFKKTNNSPIQEVTPNEAIAFQLGPLFYFEAVDFKKEGIIEKHFLRKLVAGEAALYQYFSNPTYQYVLTKADESIQISKKDSLTIERVIPDNKYIGKIKYLLRECPSIVNAKSLEFGERALTKIVTTYNNYVNPNAVKNLGAKRKLTIKLGPVAGLRYYKMSVSSTQKPNVAYEDNNVGIQVGGLINLAYFRKIALQLGAVYTSYSAENVTTSFLGTISITTKIKNIEFPILLKYNFSTNQLSPYVYGGIRIGKLLDGNARRVRTQDGMLISDDNFTYEFKSNLGSEFGLGIALNVANKVPIQVELGYSKQGMRLDLTEDVGIRSLNLNTKLFF